MIDSHKQLKALTVFYDDSPPVTWIARVSAEYTDGTTTPTSSADFGERKKKVEDNDPSKYSGRKKGGS